MVKDLVGAYSERINSYLLGTYSTSFLIYNWDLVLYALDGKMSAKDKIDKISDLLTKEDFCQPGYALIFIVVFYPFILEIAKFPKIYANEFGQKKQVLSKHRIKLMDELGGEFGKGLIETLIYMNKRQCDDFDHFINNIEITLNSNSQSPDFKRTEIVSQIAKFKEGYYSKSIKNVNIETIEAYRIGKELTDTSFIDKGGVRMREWADRVKALVMKIKGQYEIPKK